MTDIKVEHSSVLDDSTELSRGPSDTDLNNDPTIIDNELSNQEFQISLRDLNSLSNIFSAKFSLLIDNTSQTGIFEVIQSKDNYVVIKAHIDGGWAVIADNNPNREFTDWYDEKYSVEFPMLPEDTGIACLKIVNANDEIAGQIIFFADGKIKTEGIRILPEISA